MNDLESLLKKNVCWSMADSIKELCDTLLAESGINYFDYTRYYKDGTFSPLFSDKEYMTAIFRVGKARQHEEYIPPTQFLESGSYLWQSYIHPNFLEEVGKNFHHYHGVTIIRKNDLYDELINFSAPKESAHVLDIYQNYQIILNMFCGSFLNEFDYFFSKKNLRCKLPVKYKLEQQEDFNNECAIKILSKIYAHNRLRKNQVLLPLDKELVTISKTEFKCLCLLVDGLSSKEIAKIFNISSRTVEIHINALLKKMKKNNRYSLLASFSKNFLIELEKLINKSCL